MDEELDRLDAAAISIERVFAELLRPDLLAKISGVMSVVLVCSALVGSYGICDLWRGERCPDIVGTLQTILIPVVPFFLFALSTLYLPAGYFLAWVKPALAWLGASFLFIALAPSAPVSSFGFYIEKPSIVFIVCVISVCNSTWMLVVQYFLPKRGFTLEEAL